MILSGSGRHRSGDARIRDTHAGFDLAGTLFGAIRNPNTYFAHEHHDSSLGDFADGCSAAIQQDSKSSALQFQHFRYRLQEKLGVQRLIQRNVGPQRPRRAKELTSARA